MPEIFKRRDPKTGELKDVAMHSVPEVAEFFHVGTTYVRAQLKAKRWKAYLFANRYWFAPEHIDAIYDAQETETDALLEPMPPRIGLLLDPEDESSVR